MRSRDHRPDLSIGLISDHGFVIGYQGLTAPKVINSANRVDGTCGKVTITAHLIFLQKIQLKQSHKPY